MKKFLLILSVMCLLPFLSMAQDYSTAPEAWYDSFTATFQEFKTEASSPQCNPGNFFSRLFINNSDVVDNVYTIDGVEIPDGTWVGVFYEDDTTSRYCCGLAQYFRETTSNTVIFAPVCSSHVYTTAGFWNPLTEQPNDKQIALGIYFYVNDREYQVVNGVQQAFGFQDPPTLDGKYYLNSYYCFSSLEAFSDLEINGVITDELGNALNGFRVVAFQDEDTYYSNYTTDNGEYSISLPVPFTGTLTLQYLFEEASSCFPDYNAYSKEYTNLLSDETLNIVIPNESFSISGRIVDTDGNPIEGISVHFGGAYVLSDADGYYVIEDIPCGTLSVVKIASSDYPATRPFGIRMTLTEDVENADFVAYEEAYQILGRITYLDEPLDNIRVNAEEVDGDLTVFYGLAFTGEAGFYSLMVPNDFSGYISVQPTENYLFTPLNYDLTEISENKVCNFDAVMSLDASGQALCGDEPLQDVLVTLLVNGENSFTTLTDDEGFFLFEDKFVTYDDITITASKDMFETENLYTFEDVIDNVDADFVFTHIDLTISGTVIPSNDENVEGIYVRVSGIQPVLTDANGAYSVSVPYGFNGIVTPESESLEFLPNARRYRNLDSDVYNQNFTATAIITEPVTITGILEVEDGAKSVGAVAGATVFCGSQVTTSDANGFYSFVVNNGWSDILMAYHPDYHFTPVAVAPVHEDVTCNISGMPDSSPWVFDVTPKMHTIYGGFPISNIDFYPTISGVSLLPGDWIGVFQGTTCLGASKWNGGIADFYITAYGKEDGSSEGEELSYKICSYLTGEPEIYTVSNLQYVASGTIIPEVFPNSDNGNFKNQGTSIVNEMSAETDLVEISGKVTFMDDSPLANVAILIGNETIAYTDADGLYNAHVLSSWSGNAVPVANGYYFVPETRAYTDVVTDIQNQDYVAFYELYTVSGIVTDINGTPLNNVRVRIYEGSSLLKNVFTDENGYYAFDSVDCMFKGRLLPQLVGYYFEPYSHKLINTHENTTVNFISHESQMPIEWENDLVNHGSKQHVLIGKYTYPYDSDNYRFVPQLNDLVINDGDWIGAFYFDEASSTFKCAGAQQWFADEPDFIMTVFGADAFGSGYAEGEEIKLAIYSAICDEVVPVQDGNASFWSDAETVISSPIYSSEMVFTANSMSELKELKGEDNTLKLDISGNITDNNGVALENVMILDSDHTILATTDVNGNYLVENGAPYGSLETVTILPALAGYVFAPLYFETPSLNTENIVSDFVGTYYDAPWIINPDHGNQSHVTIIPDDALITVNGAELNYGNYVGIFYNDEEGELQCGGYLCYTGVNSSIVVYGDKNIDGTDNTPDSKAGFDVAEEFQWRVYSFEDDSTRLATATYQIGVELPGGIITVGGNFEHNAFSLVSEIFASIICDDIQLDQLVYCNSATVGPISMNNIIGGSGEYEFSWMMKAVDEEDWHVLVGNTESSILLYPNDIPEGGSYMIKGVIRDALVDTYSYETNVLTITWLAAISVEFEATPTVICNDGIITLKATPAGGSGNYVVSYILEDELIAQGYNVFTTNFDISNEMVGDYLFEVKVNDALSTVNCDTAYSNTSVGIIGLLGDVVLTDDEGNPIEDGVIDWCSDSFTLVAQVENPYTESFCTYKWQRRGIGANEWYSIYNAREKTYTAVQPTLMNSSDFRVIVSLPGCSGQVDTTYVTINWDNYDIDVVILNEGQTICEGGEFAELIAVADPTPYAYQWMINGQPIAEETHETLQPYAAGTYSLVAYNECGEEFVSNSVVLDIVPDVTAYAGEDAFECQRSYVVSDAVVENAVSILWEIVEGNGYLSNPTTLDVTFYYKGTGNENVTLKLTAYGPEGCNVVAEDMVSINFTRINQLEAEILGDDVDGLLCDTEINIFELETDVDPYLFTYDWVLLPARAGSIEFFDNFSLVTWSDNFIGEAQLVAKVQYCNGRVFQFVKDLYREKAPVVTEEIQGPQKVSSSDMSSNYYIPYEPGYRTSWSIYPEEAGSIDYSINQAVVNWNGDWTGFAEIIVTAFNPCGEVILSYEVERSSDFSPQGISDDVSMTIYPNPNDGSFKLNVNNFSGSYDVEVINYAGQLIFKNTYNVANPEISIPSASSGVYFVRLINENNTSVQRVIVK